MNSKKLYFLFLFIYFIGFRYEDGQQVFEEMDTNGDGYLSFDELVAWLSEDHEAARKAEVEAQRRKTSMLRANVHSKTIIDPLREGGAVWSNSGLKDGHKHFYSCGKEISPARKTSALHGEGHRATVKEKAVHHIRFVDYSRLTHLAAGSYGMIVIYVVLFFCHVLKGH